MNASPALLLASLTACSSGIFTPETNPCVLYEDAINDCSEDALYYLQDTGDLVTYTVDLECPEETALTEEEFNFYQCLEDIWDDADCTTAVGMLELSIAAAECDPPGEVAL